MVLGKLPVPVYPTINLDFSRKRGDCACSRCCLDFLLLSVISLFFLTLFWRQPHRLKYCLKGPLSPKQLTTFEFSICYNLDLLFFENVQTKICLLLFGS